MVQHNRSLATHRSVHPLGLALRHSIVALTLQRTPLLRQHLSGGDTSSHWASSSWWGSRVVEVHRYWDVRIRQRSGGRVVLRGFCVLSPVRILVPAITTILLV